MVAGGRRWLGEYGDRKKRTIRSIERNCCCMEIIFILFYFFEGKRDAPGMKIFNLVWVWVLKRESINE